MNGKFPINPAIPKIRIKDPAQADENIIIFFEKQDRIMISRDPPAPIHKSDSRKF